MKIYCFGNKDVVNDNAAIKAGKHLKELENIKFVEVKPNQDLPFLDEEDVIVMDTVEGLEEIKVLDLKAFEAIKTTQSTTAHDYDLGFQLKYLKKLGKIGKVKIIGLPMTGKIDYKYLQSILRKLVAQDIHGS